MNNCFDVVRNLGSLFFMAVTTQKAQNHELGPQDKGR